MHSAIQPWLRLGVALAPVLLWVAIARYWPRFFFLQSDTFWLVETGRYIVSNGRLPAHDIYSFTRYGETWIVYQWLFEVLLALLFGAGGWLLVSLAAALLVAWLFFVEMVRVLVSKPVNALVALVVVAAAVLVSLPDVIAIRPQLLSFVFLWLTQKTLEQNWPQPGTSLWLMVPVMIAWANTHISFVIQLAVLSVYCLCSLTSGWRSGTADRRLLPVVLCACVASSLANPYGVGIYEFLARSWADQNITPELRPVDWQQHIPLLSYVVVATVSMILARRRLGLPNLLSAVMFLLAGLAGARFILYFVIWSIPLACQAAGCFAQPWMERSGWMHLLSAGVKDSVTGRPYPFLVLIAVGAVVAVQPVYFPNIIPVKACQYLSRYRPRGPLFTGEHAGSYIIFRFRGQVPVFIDTRADVYGRRFCDLFRNVMLRGQNWREIMGRFGIRAALVPVRYRLAEELKRSGDWAPVYSDGAYVIYELK